MNKIADFTVPELNYFREMCNFSSEELEYFNLRSRNVPNVQIAMQMHVSEAKVSKLARKVKSKMFRVL